MKLKECFWLWGQDAMSHQRSAGNQQWKLPDGNQLEPVPGAKFLGIPNMCRVVMGGSPRPPFDNESKNMASMHKVVWSAIGDSGSRCNDQQTDLDEVLRQAALYPNITGAILDDFFTHRTEPEEVWARYPIGFIREMREKLHSAPRPLDLLVVWYKRQLEFKIDDYLKEFDVITYWNMRTSAEHAIIKDDLARMIERTPGKRRMTGCYIWDYGYGKPLTIDEIKFECELYYDLLKAGKTEGVIFCSNCCADVGGPAVDWLRGWIREAGEEEISPCR